jgi:hypothetical protein
MVLRKFVLVFIEGTRTQVVTLEVSNFLWRVEVRTLEKAR